MMSLHCPKGLVQILQLYIGVVTCVSFDGGLFLSCRIWHTVYDRLDVFPVWEALYAIEIPLIGHFQWIQAQAGNS